MGPQFFAGFERQFLRGFLGNRYSWWFARPIEEELRAHEKFLNMPGIANPGSLAISDISLVRYATLVYNLRAHDRHTYERPDPDLRCCTIGLDWL